jgi:divalent metal cation (Fe/Co/Zn/Cd) transporter
MERSTMLWTLVVFFGASIIFRFIRRATEDEPASVSIVLGLAALGLMVTAIVFVVKRRDGGGS